MLLADSEEERGGLESSRSLHAPKNNLLKWRCKLLDEKVAAVLSLCIILTKACDRYFIRLSGNFVSFLIEKKAYVFFK